MPARDYDPRGRASRALLVGVDRYTHDENLPGVKRNLGALFDALMSGGVFGAHEVKVESPQTGTQFLQYLERDLKQARGLFLLYFAGHGRAPQDGGDLLLACGASERFDDDNGPTYSEAVSWRTDVLPRLRNAARQQHVGQIVVILDCCFAGNALRSFGAGDVQAGSDRISVLTSVQVNRRIPAGNGSRATPYTEQLVRLLHNGVEEGTNVIRVVPLAKALRQAMRDRTTVEGDPWVPRYHRAETDHEVVIGLRAGLDDPLWQRAGETLAAWATSLRAWPRSRLRRAGGGSGALPVALTAAAVVLAAAGGYGTYRLASGHPPCAPPLELRVLTDPDVAPTVRQAVSGYLASSENHGAGGCRRSDIDVESPKATDVVTGLQQSLRWQNPSGDGDFQPQRDIGAQPDVWIPGSSTSHARADNGEGPVTLRNLGSIASSPIVLAVPRSVPAPPDNGADRHLNQLVADVRTADPKTVLLRDDPEFTDSAQLATVALYGANAIDEPVGDAGVRTVEEQTQRLSPAPRSSYELMRELNGARELREDAAVLLPEQVMAQFNARSADWLGGQADQLGRRVPLYPDDVGSLDLPFVQVTWSGGADPDAQARRDAVAHLHHWLAGPAGLAVFTDAGYRGPSAGDDQAQPADGDSWLVASGGAATSPGSVGYRVAPAAVAKVHARSVLYPALLAAVQRPRTPYYGAFTEALQSQVHQWITATGPLPIDTFADTLDRKLRDALGGR
ncbi:substrate-binding domain-containing protein [Streptomyces sp. V4-01]|uniref:Substrate-binding domain-containing protein n=1 Tax=Actinacidiphila polyblastidii TaxID=3110430 RepID=A0ABU7PGC9_9ACTN|nr:substrate-binding domain-containing protein [Streptomyces sp. V4-01]